MVHYGDCLPTVQKKWMTWLGVAFSPCNANNQHDMVRKITRLEFVSVAEEEEDKPRGKHHQSSTPRESERSGPWGFGESRLNFSYFRTHIYISASLMCFVTKNGNWDVTLWFCGITFQIFLVNIHKKIEFLSQGTMGVQGHVHAKYVHASITTLPGPMCN